MIVRSTTRSGYRWLWWATTGAALGNGVGLAAFPLLIAGQTQDPFVVSLLQVATGLPWVMFGLVAGTLVDRWDRRTIMWRTDLVRLGVVAALGAMLLLGHGSVPLILLAAFLLATGATLRRSAAPALLPALVKRGDLGAANGRLQAGSTISGSFVAPAVGGGLYAVAAAIPVLAQTLFFAISAACVLRIPRGTNSPAAPSTRRSVRQETWEGLRWLASHRVLRPIAVGTVILSAATGILMAVLVIHILVVLDLPPAWYGGMISVYAIGGVAAALMTARLKRALGTNRCLMGAALLGAVAIGALALARGPVVAGGALMVLGVATMTWNTLAVTIRQELAPDRLLGRLSSAFNVVGVGAATVAAPIGGLTATRYGTSITIAVASSLCALACLCLTRIPDIDAATKALAPENEARRTNPATSHESKN